MTILVFTETEMARARENLNTISRLWDVLQEENVRLRAEVQRLTTRLDEIRCRNCGLIRFEVEAQDVCECKAQEHTP